MPGAASRCCRSSRMVHSAQPPKWCSTREKDRMPSVRKRRTPTASLPILPSASRLPQTWAPTACSSTVSTWMANRCATSTVATLRFDAARGALSPLDTVSTVPAGWTDMNYPADIHVASSGRTLYLSNRGHNSIAVFSIAESTGGGALVLDQVVSTEGAWPRNFSLDPTGRWLLAANQRSDSVVVFGRDPETGRLTPTSQRIVIPSPVCLRFLAAPLPH